MSDDPLFRVEKVLKRKGRQVLVRWKGWPAKYDSWIPAQPRHCTNKNKSINQEAAKQRRAQVNRMAGIAMGPQALHSYTAAQKKQRRRASRHPPMRKKKPGKPKTCLTLMELERAFPNIAQQVCFYPIPSTFYSLMGRVPRSKQKVAQWL